MMNLLPRVIFACLLTGGMIVPIALRAQSKEPTSSAPAAALTPQQEAGKSLFLQNCSLCHLPDKENPKSSTEEGKTVGPRLTGLFRKANPPREEVIREFIRRGTQKMPGFQYGLEPKELDNIIAYLKTL